MLIGKRNLHRKNINYEKIAFPLILTDIWTDGRTLVIKKEYNKDDNIHK